MYIYLCTHSSLYYPWSKCFYYFCFISNIWKEKSSVTYLYFTETALFKDNNGLPICQLSVCILFDLSAIDHFYHFGVLLHLDTKKSIFPSFLLSSGHFFFSLLCWFYVLALNENWSLPGFRLLQNFLLPF